MGSDLQSHDHGSQSPSYHADMTGPWVILIHLSDGRVVASAHAMLSLTKPPGDWHRARPLWLRSPLGSESPRPGRKRGHSRSGFKLAHNKHTRTKISSAIDGQLLIQHHINQHGTKLQIVQNNIIYSKYIQNSFQINNYTGDSTKTTHSLGVDTTDVDMYYELKVYCPNLNFEGIDNTNDINCYLGIPPGPPVLHIL